MKISLIIPAYNEEEYLRDCLESVLRQTELPDEIIVVDNNSTDKTAKIAKKLGVKVIQETKQGMVQARNAGFNAARHEILARCDADTLLPNFWIERVKYNFKKHHADGVSGPNSYYDFLIKSPTPAIIYTKVMKLLINNDVLMGAHMALTKKIWGKIKSSVNLDNSVVHEDIDLSINITKVGGKIIQDRTLVAESSGRRIKSNPLSFFVEYPIRVIKTINANQ